MMIDPPSRVPRVPDAYVARFARDWRLVSGEARSGRVLVALSGGPDSSALLLLCAALGADEVHAATVDHGIRSEAVDEARQAGALAATCGVPHAILVGSLPERAGRSANLSARARVLRYERLEAHADAIGAHWIVTAHHADDQRETLVMRLDRGAGLRGLVGVRAVRGRVARPLLGWRRAELAEVVAAAGVDAVDDPSNADDRFDRARLRKALASVGWLDPEAVARSAAALADAEDAIAWTVEALFRERCRVEAGATSLDASALPREFRRRLVERCLATVDARLRPRGGEIDEVLRRLAAGGSGTLGTVAYAQGLGGLGMPARWTFAPAPPRRRG